jgi:hypothetical protein
MHAETDSAISDMAIKRHWANLFDMRDTLGRRGPFLLSGNDLPVRLTPIADCEILQLAN